MRQPRGISVQKKRYAGGEAPIIEMSGILMSYSARAPLTPPWRFVAGKYQTEATRITDRQNHSAPSRTRLASGRRSRPCAYHATQHRDVGGVKVKAAVIHTHLERSCSREFPLNL